MAEPALIHSSDDNQEDADARYASKPQLKVLEGGGGGDSVPSGSLKAIDNSANDTADTKPVSSEETAISGLGAGINSWSFNPIDKRKKRLKIRAGRGKSLNKKWLAFGGVGAGLIALFLMLLIIFLGSLLVPDLAENILTYEFARVERQFDQDNNEVLAENAAVDSVSSEAVAGNLESEFSNLSSTDNLFTKIKNLKPSNYLENLKESGTITYNYAQGEDHLGYLESITIGDKTVSIDPSTQTLKGKYFHPKQYFVNNTEFGDSVSSALEDVIPDNGIGVLMRGRVEQLIMQSIGAPRFAWIASKFTGKNQQQADDEQQAEIQADVDPNPVADAAGSIVDPEKNVIKDGAADEVASAETATENGVPKTIPPLLDGLTNSLGDSPISNVISTLNPVYAVLLPLCIIYDGSIQNTGDAQQTINLNSNEDQRSFIYLESAADQQKSGETTPEAVGALNNQLNIHGDIGSSVPMERSNNQAVNTDDIVSPQTAGNGQYTAINAISPSLASVIDPLMTNVCPIMTNVQIAGALAAVQVGLFFVGSEGADAASDVSKTVADDYLKTVAGKVAAQFDSIGITENAAARTVSLIDKLEEVLPNKNELVKIAGLSGLDVVVRLGTAMKMGTLNDGYSQGTDLANQADAGGNLNAQQDMQQQFYGVPLSSSQMAYNNVADSKFIADEYKNEGLYQRYISPSNPDSLVAKVGLDLYSDFNRSLITKFFGFFGKLFNPGSIVSSVYNLFSPNGKVLADSVSSDDQSDYGIVQWGYTNEEENLMNATSNNTYQPLENDEILSQYPNQVQKIAQTYGPCYGYDGSGVNGSGVSWSLDDSSFDMATLLTTMPSQGPDTGQYYITRDDNGNVIGGLCTDQYLSPSAGTSGTCADSSNYDPSDNMCDLVFRWRLQQAYDNTIDTLTGIANANGS